MSNQIPGPHDEAVMGSRLAISDQLSAVSLWRRLCGAVTSSRFQVSSSTLGAVVVQAVRFPDVSLYQKRVNFVTMREAGAMGVIIRAGQNSWVDPYWYENWRMSREAGLPRGSYWFYDSRRDPKEQARLWSSLVGPESGEMEHAADFEERYGGTFTGWRHWYDFLVEFQRLTGLADDRVGIYTGYYYWLEYGPNPITEKASNEWFGRYPLWEAWYTNDPSVVRIPKPWSDLRHWQYGTPAEGAAFGVESAEIDMNFANMTREAFAAKYGGAVVVPPPSDGGSMAVYEVKTAKADMSLRYDHNTGGGRKGSFPTVGTVAKANEIWTAPSDVYNAAGVQINKAGDKWAHLIVEDAWIAITHLGVVYCTYVELAPPAPPPAVLSPFDVGVMVVREGYRNGFATVHMEPK